MCLAARVRPLSVRGTADQMGRVWFSYKPADLTPGTYQLVAYGNRSKLTGVVSFIVAKIARPCSPSAAIRCSEAAWLIVYDQAALWRSPTPVAHQIVILAGHHGRAKPAPPRAQRNGRISGSSRPQPAALRIGYDGRPSTPPTTEQREHGRVSARPWLQPARAYKAGHGAGLAMVLFASELVQASTVCRYGQENR